MKIAQLVELVKAAELGCSKIHNDFQKNQALAAIEAACAEIKRRSAARKLYRQTRPAQTTTRKLIREELKLSYFAVRLKRNGEWQVQSMPGMSWQQYARDDHEAQESLILDTYDARRKQQACGCTIKHSDAAGVIAACQLGKEQGSDETWTGF